MLITGHWESGHLTIMGRIREDQYAYLDYNLPLSLHSRGQQRERETETGQKIFQLKLVWTFSKTHVCFEINTEIIGLEVKTENKVIT